MLTQKSVCLFLNQKPCSSVGQPGPFDSGRGVGEFLISFSCHLFLIWPLTFPLEGGDYTIPPASSNISILFGEINHKCCWAPSLYKTSLEFITWYLNSLILHLMERWIRIASFKPKIVFLQRLFSSLSVFTPSLIISPVMLAGTHLTPLSVLDYLPWWKMFHINGFLSMSACAHVCNWQGVYSRGWFLASQGWFLKRYSLNENRSEGSCRYEE